MPCGGSSCWEGVGQADRTSVGPQRHGRSGRTGHAGESRSLPTVNPDFFLLHSPYRTCSTYLTLPCVRGRRAAFPWLLDLTPPYAGTHLPCWAADPGMMSLWVLRSIRAGLTAQGNLEDAVEGCRIGRSPIPAAEFPRGRESCHVIDDIAIAVLYDSGFEVSVARRPLLPY